MYYDTLWLFFIKEHLKFRHIINDYKMGKIFYRRRNKRKTFQAYSFLKTAYCYIIFILIAHQKPDITILIHRKQFLNRPRFGRKIIVTHLFNSLHLLWSIFGSIIDLS